MAGKAVTDFIKMQLFKKGGAIASDKAVKFSADALEKRLINLGVNPNSLNSQTELKQLLAYVKQMEDAAFNQQFSGIMKNQNLFKKEGEVVPFKQKRSFAEEIDDMKKSGDIVDVDDIKISEKITNREMFKNSNLNKDNSIMGQINERMDNINKASKKLDDIMKEREEMYRPKTDAEIKAKFDKENKESIKRFKDKMKKEDDEGFYTGGMVDVEPSLSDIGHGSDSLMARTRLVSPGNQATTSTGLNYLLAEDNDNIRVPFSSGGMGRRAFLKLMAALTGGVAAAKSGILGLGEGAGKKVVTKTVEKAAGATDVPPYFFKLVDKIKTMGDETLASQDKAIAKKYKDYVMEEDFAGNITIIKKNMDDPYPEEVIMSYKVDEVTLPGRKGSAKVDDYEEFTVRPDGDGKMKDIEPGVPDEVVQEGTMFEDNMTEFGVTKKAEGGRIGYAEKGIVDLADLESLKGLKEEGLNSEDGKFITNPRRQQARGIAALGAQGAEAGKKQKEDIKNKVIGAFTYVVDNLDQETASYVKSLFNDKLQLGYSTTMSGIKQDAFAKTGIVPIDSETIYNAIINLNLPNDVKLKMSAISDTAGDEQIKASLKSNNLGITYDSDKQEIIAQYTNVITPDGSLRITPIIAKDENSNMIKDIQIDKAFENGDLKFSINESDIFNQKNIGTKYDGENISFFAEKKQDDYGNTLDTGLTLDLPVYLLNKEEKPSVSFNLNKDLNSDFETKMFSGNFPITDNLSLFGSRKEDDSGEGNQTNYGLEYNYQKPLGERGNFFTKANIDNKGDYGFNIGLSIPFGQPEKKAPFQFSTNKPEEAYEIYKKTDGFKTDPRDKRELPPRLFDEGGRVPLAGGKDVGGGSIIDPDFDDMDLDEWVQIIKLLKSGELGYNQGGRINFSGGGIFRAIIAKAAAAKGMKPYEFIKVTNYKGLPPEVKMFMSADDFAKLKSGQETMYNNYIDMMKTRKNFQQEVEAGKKTPASPIFEHMEKTMDQQSYVPKTVTADDIAEAELMVKNRFQKGRKDNAQGGLQTMLGE